ncbi:energy transducer TonB [uncultured Tenacibaculum sp.]|uniref:energy transducer TonB n=1 Tax=uncultured Tenacibaculum sp. TaxID=174713 RepID=UPI0026169974|nr:energy transducer TonB [uncultured Tenacibaculum sp.]
MKKAFLLLLLTGIGVIGYSQNDTINTSSEIVKVERPPVHRRCRKFKTAEEIGSCLNKQVKKHFNRAFYIDYDCIVKKHVFDAKKNKKVFKCIPLDAGKYVVYVQFKINKEGYIKDITVKNAPHIAVEREAIRVIKRIRKMKEPAELSGIPVEVGYTLPFTITVEE